MKNIIFKAKSNKNWREMLDEINVAQKEWCEYSGIMTPYEKATAQREYNNLRDQYKPAITKGLLAIHEDPLQKLKRADDRVKSEKKKEITVWDVFRLVRKMQVYEMLYRHAINTKKGTKDFDKTAGGLIEKIYNEAKESGDRYKQRASAEVLNSVATQRLTENDRLKINHLA